MIQRVFTTVFNRLVRAGNGVIFLVFFLGSLILRLPFFFRDYVDRDESTFILMAQSIADGHLPYAQLWDLKPPLLFFIFSIPISLFGKSLLAIRVTGWLVTSCISFFTFLIGLKTDQRITGLAAGIGCMFLMSLGGSVQGVMSEHFSVFFLLPAVLWLLGPATEIRFGLSGFFLAMAVLCKSNLVLVLPVLGLLLLAKTLGKSGKMYRTPLLFLIIGGTLGITSSMLPYLNSGQFTLWWDAVIKAPLAYSEVANIGGSFYLFYLIFGFLLWLALKKNWLRINAPEIQLLCIVLIGILLAFFKGGRINGHYLLQFYPIALVLLFTALRQLSQRVLSLFTGGIVLWMLLLPVESYLEYAALFKNYRDSGQWYNGEGVVVPAYLNRNFPNEKKVFFLEYHIGYWFMDAQPPSAVVTHPSNLCRTSLYPFIPGSHSDSESEIRYIMDTVQPQIIVRRKGKPIFDHQFMIENAELESYLLTQYYRDTTLGRAEVYLRR
ncbi:MAG: hypothetical protein RLZZ241_1530 [Bacteroidota bacterium]|jgi:4-amino-4-deoxy-L-arabinose transferase-like glycosyltransferase